MLGALIAQLVLAQAVDPLSGGAGWVGAGLLGAVLAWLMFAHLPAKDRQISAIIETKDKQISEILQEQSLDRERERTDRHDRANTFQKILNEMTKENREQMRDLNSEHIIDAEKDRNAFLQRSADIGSTMRMAIENQTLQLQRAITDACHFTKAESRVSEKICERPA